MDTLKKEDVITAADKVVAESTGGGKAKVFEKMSPAMKKAVREELKRREKGESSKTPEPARTEESLDDIDWGKIGTGGTGGVSVKTVTADVTEKELDDMWSSIEADDTSEYDLEAAAAFDYQGFNATTILTQVMMRGKGAGLDKKTILKDISMMCAISHKKGSINDKNYQKMKKSGQTEYDRLAGLYKIVKGGAKGQPPEVLTISRIGPTFSSKIVRLILDEKLSAKSFVGPMKSSTLHSCMQTQFFVTVVPSTLPSRSQEFISGLCRAYSVDQTIALAQGKKPTTEESWEKQANFIELTKNSDHPSDTARKSMMAKIPWPDVYDKSSTCVAKIKIVDSGFLVPSRADFLSDIAKV
jgi:hypothetical protein